MPEFDRSLDSLSSEFKPLVFELLARLVEHGVMVMIVQTSRTVEQATQNVANGTSATSHSKHLPRSLRGIPVEPTKCDAIDLCPYDVYQLVGPDKLQWGDDLKGHPAFTAIGEIAETFRRLRWGGNWHTPHDPGHVELLFPGEHYVDIPQTAVAYNAFGPLQPSTTVMTPNS